MANEVEVITEEQARQLTAGAERVGYSHITASGTFSSSHRCADGSFVECYINFGWPKYFHVPAGYVQPESWMSRRGLVY